MKKLMTVALALIVLTALSGTSNAQKKPGTGVPVPLPGYNLTVQVLGPQCPPPAPGVKNTPPWVPTGQKINCTSAGGDCSEANIPAGTTVRLSTAPFNPTGSWSITGGPVTPTPGTCGYSQINVGHQDCEFKMPPNNIMVRVELPCPPPPATSCQQDLNSGKLTISTPTVSSVTATSASLTGTINVSPIPSGCTYTAKLVWGPVPTPPFPNTAATGTIPPPGPLTLTGPAQPLQPNTVYGARIEVTKQCGGIAPTTCFGPTKHFETPQETGKCDLTIGKSLAHGIRPPLQTGQQAIFEIVVKNQGTGTCQAPISVTDTFSAGLTYVSGGTSGWVCPAGPLSGPNTVTCTNSTPLAPSGGSLLLVTFNVTAPPPKVVGDCATVKNPNDTNLANNRACIDVPVAKPKLPDLTIKKHMSCPGPTTPQGTKCTITFTITNNGPGTFSGILVLSDVLTPTPSSLSWAGGSTPTSTPQGWGWSCGIGLPTNDIGCSTTSSVTLAPPGSTTFSVDVYIPACQYENCASVKGYTQFPYTSSTLTQEVTFNNNQSCVPIQVGPPCKDVKMNLSTGQNPNWTVNSGPVYNTSPVQQWVAPAGGANWIQPANSPTPQLLPAGNYQYRIPFTLPGCLSQYSSITIAGQYAADNSVTAMSMNGGPSVASCTGPIIPAWGPDCFSTWHPFTIPAGFAASNTLDVTVGNNPTPGGGPTYTGLIVNATLRAICK